MYLKKLNDIIIQVLVIDEFLKNVRNFYTIIIKLSWNMLHLTTSNSHY